MKKLVKLSALLLAVLMIALAGMAGAADLSDGEIGGYTQPDQPQTQDKSVNIRKEIIAYNANSTEVHAPVVTYTYTVTAADVSAEPTVTDDTTDHTSEAAVTAPVKAGITTGLVVTGTAAGTAGNASGATGTLVFTNDSAWSTAADGATNGYDIKLDFSNVAFTQPGVYRYQIEESISADSYAAVALKDGGSNIRYLDVYVAGNLDIYGYVCIADNDSVTSGTTKSNGFVASDNDTINGADSYYTYDLTLSKDVENDSYAEGSTAFPFTVIFRNSESYTSTFAIGETAGTGSTGINPGAAAPAWSGVARVKEGGAITYTGIPAGVDVDVYETNIVTGVTYTVSTSVNGGTATTDEGVIAGDVPTSAVAQTAKASCESTKVTVDTTKNTAVSATQTIAITNTLSLISPTGLVIRFAPYGLLLIGGIVLLVIAMKHRKHNEEE